ncbi:MAG TPA: phosphotransferase [Paenibacillus sp.]|nr:phosphotransferase [Paenibacillus sp.]
MVTTEKLYERVEAAYGIRLKTHEVIKHLPDSSFVAKLAALSGDLYALKCLFEPEERQRFIVESERLLAERGVPLARPVATKDGERFFEWEGNQYVLYEWLPGDGAPLERPEDLLKIVELAARFHRASQGLAYPAGARTYGHLDWREEYESRLQSMERWRADHATASGKKRRIADAIPFFLKAGALALRELRESGYESYAAAPPTLVHGDLHNRNVMLHRGELRLIDFEDVRYDAPSKDLIRIYSMYAKRRVFEEQTFRDMLNRYNDAHPLPKDVRRLVEIDLLFPHVFERTLRKKKYKKMSEEEVDFWLEQERRRTAFVKKRYFGRKSPGKEGRA